MYSCFPAAFLLEKVPYSRAQEFFCRDASVAYDEGCLRMKQLFEFLQPFCLFFGIAVDFNGCQGVFLPQDEIYFIVAFAPVKDFETVDKGLADQVGTDTGFDDMPPRLPFHEGLSERVGTIDVFQGIVIDLQLGDAGFPSHALLVAGILSAEYS